MKTIMNDNYYDVAELAIMFGLSVTTIRSYFKDGRIKAMKLGKSWHAKEIDIKDFLAKEQPQTKISN